MGAFNLSDGTVWGIIVAAAGMFFTAGRLVEKIRTTKFVSKEECALHHKAEDIRWNEIKDSIHDVKGDLRDVKLDVKDVHVGIVKLTEHIIKKEID